MRRCDALSYARVQLGTFRVCLSYARVKGLTLAAFGSREFPALYPSRRGAGSVRAVDSACNRTFPFRVAAAGNLDALDAV